jgi:hypothetical protein
MIVYPPEIFDGLGLTFEGSERKTRVRMPRRSRPRSPAWSTGFRRTSRDGDAHTATLTVENHCMSNVFEIRDPDTGAVIERVERKDMPPAARQAMAEGIQRMLDRREIVFTGERNAKGKPIYRSMIYEGDRDPRREN